MIERVEARRGLIESLETSLGRVRPREPPIFGIEWFCILVQGIRNSCEVLVDQLDQDSMVHRLSWLGLRTRPGSAQEVNIRRRDKVILGMRIVEVVVVAV